MLALVAFAVAVLFRFGPNVAVSFRWTLVGGFVFAVGWVAATAVFGLYVANFGSYANTYGALGGVIVLMLWFYLTAVLLLVAAEVTAVLAKQHEPEDVDARRAETGPAGSAKAGGSKATDQTASSGAGPDGRTGARGGRAQPEAGPRGRRGCDPAAAEDAGDGPADVLDRARARTRPAGRRGGGRRGRRPRPRRRRSRQPVDLVGSRA